jgi:ubiquinone/menaquinone biosynthesis C-methylase UbiE
VSSNETIDSIEESRSASAAAGPAANRPKSVEDVREAYARYADWIDRLGWLDRLLTGRYRRRQFASAEGRVLEVACGTGTNFRYLPESVDLVRIDVSEEMLARARTELGRLGRDGTLERMNAQALAFDDDRFETVVSSFSTCTFLDPIAALREMERVCAPDGRILLVEHGRSDVESIARYQEWRADAHYQKAGCRVTQEPLKIVRRAGLSIEATETGQFGRITAIEASPAAGGTR